MNAYALLSLVSIAFPQAAADAAPVQVPGKTPVQTPAQRHIASAELSVLERPADFQAYNRLALALSRRARETADPEFYELAEEALAKSLELSPDNLEARKVGVWVLLGQHEFAEALDQAQALNKRFPDDVLVYGFLVDAYVELGEYGKAEDAAQWMLDLRPGNVAGLTRGAYLRELFGDVEGAIELMAAAYPRVQPNEVEDRAWILTQIAHLEQSRGRAELAAQYLEKALELMPEYHYALAGLARARATEGRLDEAVELYRRRYEVAPHPENLFEVAVALEAAGKSEEAAPLFADFERDALAESANVDNANRELIGYWVDHVGTTEAIERAVELARTELERRRDVHTREAFAWALFASGDEVTALEELEHALEVGIQDARMLFRAGVVARANGEVQIARDYLTHALALEPRADFATRAFQVLAELAPTSLSNDGDTDA